MDVPVACALVPDLIDRSRIAGAVPAVRFVRGASECADASLVVIDLGAAAREVRAVRSAAPDAYIVCFGPHVDDDAMSTARESGADVVMPRSRFFRDVAAALRAP